MTPSDIDRLPFSARLAVLDRFVARLRSEEFVTLSEAEQIILRGLFEPWDGTVKDYQLRVWDTVRTRVEGDKHGTECVVPYAED